MPLPQKKLIPGIFLMLVVAALAAPPLWWGTGNPPVIDPAAVENNHGPANIGQAKHMAKSAIEALRAVFPTVADEIEADLTAGPNPIVDFTVPDPKTPEWIEKQKAPLLIGQLKAIADPFYTRLHAAAPAWLEAERIENGTNNPGSIFPWTSATSDDNNKGMANIGQLKAVFSLRFETIATFDSDGDGMPDLWENENGLNPNDPDDANQDNDGDGLNNAQELAAGRDPNSADIWGLVNADFRGFIQPGALMSFRDEHPSDLYYGDDIVGWHPNEGDYIEIWQEDDDSTPEPDDGDRYIELQSHLGAHGVKQEFPMLSKSRMTFILRYKGRYETEASHNAFELKVEGAAKLTVDGTEVTEDNGVRTRFFTDTEEWQGWKIAVVTIIAPEDEAGFSNVTLSLVPGETEYGGEHITHGGFVSILPVKVVEVLPKIVDENNVEIPNADKPANSPKSTEMVERAPLETPTALTDASVIRIAWRDMKVKIGKSLEGKTVTWSMTPQFTPSEEFWPGVPYPANYMQLRPVSGDPRFRGSWTHAATANHKHRFSPSTAYVSDGIEGNYNFNNFFPPLLYNDGDLPQGSIESEHDRATTTVDSDGYTAIRVNMPPIGFNKARIKIQIEDTDGTIDLIDMEVPAVIVIDPGHGTGGVVDFSKEGSVGLHSNVAEYDSALDIGTRTLKELALLEDEEDLLIKMYSTKNSNNPRQNIGLDDREEKARKWGADIYVSLHFDGATHDPNSREALYRNPFGMIDQDDSKWNRNPRADWALARRVRIAVQTAIAAVEPAESIQASESAYDQWDATHNPNAERVTSEINETRLQSGLGALNDGINGGTIQQRQNGNYRDGDVRYTPCRATLIEMERTANEQADNLFNGNTAYNATTGAITLTAVAESMRARVAIEIARACINDALIRDLADQTDVPVRTNRVPLLDFESN